MILLSFVVSFYGFLHFAMSVKKHQMDVYKGWCGAASLSRREYWCMQMIGWCALSVSYAMALQVWNVGIGSMAWLMLITVSAMLVVVMLSYRLDGFQWLWRYTSLGYRLAPPTLKKEKDK